MLGVENVHGRTILTWAAGSEVKTLEPPRAEGWDVVFQLPENLTKLGPDWSMKKTGWERARLKSKNKYKNRMACTGGIRNRRPAQMKEKE